MARNKRHSQSELEPKKHDAASDKPKPLTTIAWFCWFLLVSFLFGFQRIGHDLSATVKILSFGTQSAAQLDFLVTQGLNLLLLGVFFGTTSLAGRLLFRCFQYNMLTVAEELIFGLGLGLGFLSILALFLGLIGQFNSLIMRYIWVGIVALAILFHSRSASWVANFGRAPSPSGQTSNHILFATTIITTVMVINLLSAMGPEVFYDSLVYHLALPQLYLINHRILPTPHNIYSGIPFNTEMLFAWGLAINGEGLAKLIPWGILLSLLVAIVVCARRFANAQVGFLAALLVCSCPMLSVQTWFSLVELNWCFLAFLAIFGLLIGLERTEGAGCRWMGTVGTLAGFAMGTKYNAFPLIFILLIVFYWTRVGRQTIGWRKASWEVAPLVLACAATLSPWLIKNWLFYHNPFFPFLNEIFVRVPGGPDWLGLFNDAHPRRLWTTFTTWPGFMDLFSSLWSREWAISGIDSMGIALLLFLPGILFVNRSGPYSMHHSMAIALLLSWSAWAFSSRFPRFFIAAVPLLAFMIASGIYNQKSQRLVRLLTLILVASSIANCSQIFNLWFRLGGWKVVFGQQTRSQYLQQNQMMYPTPYYAAAEFVNANLPPNAKILFLEESRGYYFKRDFIATSSFSRNPFIDYVNQSKDAAQLRAALRKAGITHIFVNQAEMLRKGSIAPFSEEGKLVFNSFVRKHLRQIFRKVIASPPALQADRQWVEVYEVI